MHLRAWITSNNAAAPKISGEWTLPHDLAWKDSHLFRLEWVGWTEAQCDVAWQSSMLRIAEAEELKLACLLHKEPRMQEIRDKGRTL